VLYLAAVGGDTIQECVRLIMRRLLRRSVSLRFSFMGRQGKRAFRDLKICKVVFGEDHQFTFSFSYFHIVLFSVYRDCYLRYDASLFQEFLENV
jgi:hypothetical protein